MTNGFSGSLEEEEERDGAISCRWQCRRFLELYRHANSVKPTLINLTIQSLERRDV